MTLTEVDEVLLRHPLVEQAVMFSSPTDIRLGEAIGAAVKLSGTVTEIELHKFVAEHVPWFKRPQRIVIVDELPHGASPFTLGKKTGLMGSKEGDVLQQEPYVAPRGEVELFLQEQWALFLKGRTVGVKTGFLDSGGDSLSAIQLLRHLETMLSLELSIVDFFDAATIEEQALLIERKVMEEQIV